MCGIPEEIIVQVAVTSGSFEGLIIHYSMRRTVSQEGGFLSGNISHSVLARMIWWHCF